MKHRTPILFVLAAVLTMASFAAGLEDGFHGPPDSAKPWCYLCNMARAEELMAGAAGKVP